MAFSKHRYLRLTVRFPPHATTRPPPAPIEEDRVTFSPPQALALNNDDQAKRLPPVGRCIYCGATEFEPGTGRRLSEEHIVTEGLGARLILPEASCLCCANKTKKIEGAILRRLLWPSRRQLGIRGKKRIREEKDYPVTAIVNGKEVIVRFPLETHPTALFLLSLNAPGLILETPIDEHVQGVWVMELNDFNEMVRHGLPEFCTPALDTVKFCQLLAKIAHGYAVATFGLDNFNPLLPEFILKEFERTENYVERYQLVGGDPTPYAPSDALHTLGWGVAPTNETNYLVVAIRLFGNLGAPVYQVVVGTPANTMQLTLDHAPTTTP